LELTGRALGATDFGAAARAGFLALGFLGGGVFEAMPTS
jgi:hypothetical protein